MVYKKVAKRKVVIKRVKTVQKAKGRGPNININIDQSKRTTRKTTSQAQPRQPQVISTITPSYIPFPFPTPNLNPFENVIRETQKASVKPEQNELEKPKKQTSETTAQTDDIPEATIIQPSSIPVKEDIPIVKAIQIKPPTKKKEMLMIENLPYEDQNDEEYKKYLEEYKKYLKDNKQHEKTKRRNKSMQDEPDLSESLWFNPSRESNTPLEQQQQATQSQNILTIYEPKKRPVKSGIHTMTNLIENNERQIDINPEFKPFLGIGNVLGSSNLFNELDLLNKLEQTQHNYTRKELRDKRLKKFDQGPKESIFESKVEQVINEPKQEEQIIKPTSLTIFEPKVEHIKVVKRPYIMKEPIILKNISYEDELKEREKERKEQERKYEEAKKKYPNMMSDKTPEELDYGNYVRFLEHNPGKTREDYLEQKKMLEEQEKIKKARDKILMREYNERFEMQNEDERYKLEQIKDDLRKADRSREGYKKPEVIKKEKEFEDYKNKVKNMDINELRALAKQQGLPQKRGAKKQDIVYLLLQNA